VLVRADGEPIAIAPFMRTVERVYGRQVRCLRFLANDHTPRCDFIIAARPHDAYRAIWNFLMTESSLWDMVVLRQLPADSRTVEEISRRAEQSGVLLGRWDSEVSPFVPLLSGWDRYMETLPAKHRSNLRNRFKRLSALGGVEFETVSAKLGFADALEEGLRLEAAAWKEQAGSAIRCQPDVRRFYSLLAERAATRGWLRLQFLKVDDRRIAFGYCLAYQNRMYLIKPGFEPAYAPYSPGNLLCHHSLRDAFASGFAAYDFLGRDDDWKRQWSTQTLPHCWLFLFADRPWARLAHYAKFELIPVLQELPLYVRLRDRLFGQAAGIGASRHPLRQVISPIAWR
jgi:CelD/BcsL family acetyltransferase involved in cellulose biosynthesis